MKVAVIVSVPAGNVDVEREALPPANVTVPSVVEPYANVTVPAGVTPFAATVAVKVTAAPGMEGFNDEASAVLVGPGLTTCAKAVETLSAENESPSYSAVIESVPAGKPEVEKAATPPDSEAVPIAVVPFLKTTVPVGVGPAEVTATENVTDCG